ncbi:MAG: MSEP-CTERM sorting domain-containing protein [Candidatus Kapaibacterium sp.]
MQNLRNPQWLFLVNTLPIVVLFMLCIGEFTIIKSLLSEENIYLWRVFGSALGVLGAVNFGYAMWLVIKKQTVPMWYGITALVCYIGFLYAFGFHVESMIPASIPQWMFSGDIILYTGTFLMPTLAYSLFITVAHYTPEDTKHEAWKSFLAAFVIPVSWYLFTQLILPFWKHVEDNFNVHGVIILIIISTLLFLFFLVRALLIVVTKKAELWQKYHLLWKIPITLVLPLLGLAVNNGLLFKTLKINASGIFGDFTNPWFYVLAMINSLFLCLPNLDKKIYRILLFIGRSITFAFSFYFFLVFLPFLPLSVMAVIAVGTGFLLLAPLLLFVLHIQELTKDISYLKRYYSQSAIGITAVMSFVTIPLILTGIFMHDRIVLHQALGYLYTPDYSKQYDIDKSSLQKTLAVVKYHKEKNRRSMFGSQIPYLSSYFSWLVLDNLTLSDAKIASIEQVFFEGEALGFRSENIQNDSVRISHLATRSTYDSTQNAWLSWVDAEITNHYTMAWAAEYAATIHLPEGAWISDYYLYVNGKKEMGILAEKKTAMWVFSNIRNERKDPGILYYLTDNRVAFRVFPFAKGEVRKTGFQIIHKEPIDFTLGTTVVHLGTETESAANRTSSATMGSHEQSANVVYISAKDKHALPHIQRTPYLHFIVDISKNNASDTAEFMEQIRQVTEANKALTANAKISFVNTYTTTIPLQHDWQQQYKSRNFDGGFYLDRGIRTALFDAYSSHSATYPIVVVLTNNLRKAIIDKDFSDLRVTFPENDCFYTYSSNQKDNLQPHSLLTNPMEPLPDTLPHSFSHPVAEYVVAGKKFYLPDNNQASVVLVNDRFDVLEQDIKEKNWHSALMMQGKWQSQILHPETSDKEWLDLVRYSFISKIMTPVTSYLVVENEAQKAILKKKQEQVLASNKSLDLGEEAMQMSEPGTIITAILLGLGIWYRQRRRRMAGG